MSLSSPCIFAVFCDVSADYIMPFITFCLQSCPLLNDAELFFICSQCLLLFWSLFLWFLFASIDAIFFNKIHVQHNKYDRAVALMHGDEYVKVSLLWITCRDKASHLERIRFAGRNHVVVIQHKNAEICFSLQSRSVLRLQVHGSCTMYYWNICCLLFCKTGFYLDLIVIFVANQLPLLNI